MFDSLNVSQGKMTWPPGIDAYMVNSIIFDVATADLSLTNSLITGIFTNYSSPVIYIANDPTASSPQ
jgi:hypothetical protein